MGDHKVTGGERGWDEILKSIESFISCCLLLILGDGVSTAGFFVNGCEFRMVLSTVV